MCPEKGRDALGHFLKGHHAARKPTARKRERQLAEARAYGYHKGLEKAHQSKSLMDSAREHIGKMIDRIDPIETFAILGATYMIKTGIEWGEEVAVNPSAMRTLLLLSGPNLVGQIGSLVVPEIPEEMKQKMREAMDKPEVEVLEWLISFTLAFFLIRTGKDLQGSIVSAAKGLLGIAA